MWQVTSLTVWQNFLSKTPRERYELIKVNKLRQNCFGRNHVTIECWSRIECKLVHNSKHNTMLYFEDRFPRAGYSSVAQQFLDSSPVLPCQVRNAQAKTILSKNLVAVTEKKSCSTIVYNKTTLLPIAVVHFQYGSIFRMARILAETCYPSNFNFGLIR